MRNQCFQQLYNLKFQSKMGTEYFEFRKETWQYSQYFDLNLTCDLSYTNASAVRFALFFTIFASVIINNVKNMYPLPVFHSCVQKPLQTSASLFFKFLKINLFCSLNYYLCTKVLKQTSLSCKQN